MANEIKAITMTDGSGNTKKETRVEIRKIKNGYIQRTSVEGRDKKGDWYNEVTEEYFEENPIKGLKLPS